MRRLNMLMIGLALLGLSHNAMAEKAKTGSYYANANKFELDPNLPEPFARTTAAQVIVNHDQAAVGLVFLMSETEGINVDFPIVKDTTDACNNREILAVPPSDSTPYYKDFEIKVIDYSENTCANVEVPAATFATLRSYEVKKDVKTFSKLYAEKLKISEEQ
jgi:hypothetical protein